MRDINVGSLEKRGLWRKLREGGVELSRLRHNPMHLFMIVWNSYLQSVYSVESAEGIVRQLNSRRVKMVRPSRCTYFIFQNSLSSGD
jgi:hypothetical protein